MCVGSTFQRLQPCIICFVFFPPNIHVFMHDAGPPPARIKLRIFPRFICHSESRRTAPCRERLSVALVTGRLHRLPGERSAIIQPEEAALFCCHILHGVHRNLDNSAGKCQDTGKVVIRRRGHSPPLPCLGFNSRVLICSEKEVE